jgi:hypothetical protein
VDREALDPTKMIWMGLVALAAIGIVAAAISRNEFPEEEAATPGPSPAAATLQCLDGKTYRSVEKLSGQTDADGFPTRAYWTLTFAEGGYVLDQGGVHEAGRYRCDGFKLSASGSLGSHRGQLEPNGPHLEWDGLGYETDSAATPAVTTTTAG